MSKKSCFRWRFHSQRVNGSQTLLKSARQYFNPILSSVWDKLSFNTSLLLRSHVSGLFPNTLTADGKNPHHNNLQRPIQMQLSKKPKTFCGKFIACLKSLKNFEDFEKTKKHELNILSISEIIHSEKFDHLNA